MNQEIKQEWLRRLRSGDYKQGHSYLRSRLINEDGYRYEGYCCLGVLCEIAAERGIILPAVFDEEEGTFVYIDGVNSGVIARHYPSHKVAEWAELDDPNPSITHPQRNLAQMNDHGHTFEEIANEIEAQLLCRALPPTAGRTARCRPRKSPRHTATVSSATESLGGEFREEYDLDLAMKTFSVSVVVDGQKSEWLINAQNVHLAMFTAGVLYGTQLGEPLYGEYVKVVIRNSANEKKFPGGEYAGQVETR